MLDRECPRCFISSALFLYAKTKSARLPDIPATVTKTPRISEKYDEIEPNPFPSIAGQTEIKRSSIVTFNRGIIIEPFIAW
jgi:hypothetical protein